MELSERMTKTVAGQLTWADPSLGKTCDQCKHIGKHPKPKNLKPNVCTLVKAHTQRVGAPFLGSIAIACSRYE